ncbi:hypothetical protein [Polycladidibacter hongkongensis]|uniref:hypothetical protein n=1 Tax=Polycladidibacter hongkongensis TaxID=1647556 RepID=UPI00083002BA|nr:hypothetical protein [Pseudovibrio hongkongensis]
MPTDKTRSKICRAYLECLATAPVEQVGFAEIAEGAQVSLSEVRACFSRRSDILAWYYTQVDQQVLAQIDADLAGEPVREQLFDCLMNRLDALSADSAALLALDTAACKDPVFAGTLLSLETRSMHWMLDACAAAREGIVRQVAARGLALGFVQVMRVWLQEDDEAKPRTMSELDRVLRRGENMLSRVARVEACLQPVAVKSFRLASCVAGAMAAGRRKRRRPEAAEHTA